jgi:hypothetical protein
LSSWRHRPGIIAVIDRGGHEEKALHPSAATKTLTNDLTCNLRTLRPLSLCEKYSEIWSRGKLSALRLGGKKIRIGDVSCVGRIARAAKISKYSGTKSANEFRVVLPRSRKSAGRDNVQFGLLHQRDYRLPKQGIGETYQHRVDNPERKELPVGSPLRSRWRLGLAGRYPHLFCHSAKARNARHIPGGCKIIWDNAG